MEMISGARRAVGFTALGLGLAIGFAVAIAGLPGAKENAEAFDHLPKMNLSIDADITNGSRPCDPIDIQATVEVGTTHQVGVCLGNYPANTVDVIDLYVTNTQSINFAPDPEGAEEPNNGGSGPDCRPCLDDNPNANDGDDPAGFKLGSGWACGLIYWPPRSETLPIRLPCNVDIRNPDMDLAAEPGLLATITFDAVAGGVDMLSFVDPTGVGSVACMQSDLIDCVGATINVIGDADGDGVPDGVDNCPSVYNPGQENRDSTIGNGTGLPNDDGTAPNGDRTGDVCDDDADNDGITSASDSDPGGDITYDDNNNGSMCPTDAADDGPSWDSNCNGVVDGMESDCPLTVNPNADDDGDGLRNTWEVCKWGTSPAVIDSDADGRGDCLEAADVNGDAVVSFSGDVIAYAKAVMLPDAAFGKDGDFDMDGNNALSFTGDVIQEAKFAMIAGLCQ